MKFLILFFLCFLAASIGCVTPARDAFRFSLEDVQAHGMEHEKGDFSPPYVARFLRKNKVLTYVAANHISLVENPNPLESPTFKTIGLLLKNEKIQAVIVEGIPSKEDLSSSSFVSHAKECRQINYTVNCGEPWFAINLATAQHVYVTGGEPDETFILNEIVKAGFNAEDLSNFYLVRMIPALKREKRFDHKTFEAWARQNLQIYRKELQLTEPYRFEDFKKWYSLHMQKPKTFMAIGVDDTGPDSGPEATYVQKISFAVNIARDRSAVATAERLLNRFDRVLIVYGASHLLNQGPAFAHAFDKLEYKKFF